MGIIYEIVGCSKYNVFVFRVSSFLGYFNAIDGALSKGLACSKMWVLSTKRLGNNKVQC